jgi:hypothetical protein
MPTSRSANDGARGPVVELSADWLARVYAGPDPEGFRRWLGRMVTDPDALVIARAPNVLGVARVFDADYELGRIAKGYLLTADWPSVLTAGMQWARARGAGRFLYPVLADNPKAAQIGRVLERRYGFTLYQRVYGRLLDDSR